jgi:hypothetical protein
MAALARAGEYSIGGVTVRLATPRIDAIDSYDSPCAAWWANDKRLLALDTGQRPLLDALVAAPATAPVWLTAFNVDVGAAVGLPSKDPFASSVTPVVVSPDVQQVVSDLSAGMNLTNGVYDSCVARLWTRRGASSRAGCPVRRSPSRLCAPAGGQSASPTSLRSCDSRPQPTVDRARKLANVDGAPRLKDMLV